jgi:hypothetical protein
LMISFRIAPVCPFLTASGLIIVKVLFVAIVGMLFQKTAAKLGKFSILRRCGLL